MCLVLIMVTMMSLNLRSANCCSRRCTLWPPWLMLVRCICLSYRLSLVSLSLSLSDACELELVFVQVLAGVFRIKFKINLFINSKRAGGCSRFHFQLNWRIDRISNLVFNSSRIQSVSRKVRPQTAQKYQFINGQVNTIASMPTQT